MADIAALAEARRSTKLVIDDQPQVEEPLKPKKKKKPTKAERKERKRLQAIEFQKLEIRDHLRRELELSKKSQRRGQKEWEDICKDIKIAELREELMEWSEKTERVFTKKDKKISHLLDDMNTTQEMQKRGFENHVRILDYITECYTELANCAKLLYDSEASIVIQDFYNDIHARAELQDFNKSNCDNIMHTTNLIVEQEIIEDYNIFLKKRDERISSEIEKRYMIRDGILLKMKALQDQLLGFIKSIRGSSLDSKKYSRIDTLMEKQKAFLKESDRLNRVEFHQTKCYTELEHDFVHREIQSRKKLNDLRLEYEYFLRLRKDISENMLKDQRITFDKIKSMTINSYDVIKQFKKYGKYGELLLSLAATCRKLQTESEKVVTRGRFDKPTEDGDQNMVEDERFNIWTLQLADHVDLTDEELFKQMQLMRNFWHRHALAETQVLLLNEEKNRLTEENEKYIKFIKSMSKTDNVDELSEAVTINCIIPGNVTCESEKKARLQM